MTTSRQELRDAINAIMMNGKIKSVVFREFTVQWRVG